MSERHFERLLLGESAAFHEIRPLPTVREYAPAPTPLVRDGWSRIETRDVEAVLAGGIERFLDGPEGGDPF